MFQEEEEMEEVWVLLSQFRTSEILMVFLFSHTFEVDDTYTREITPEFYRMRVDTLASQYASPQPA